MSAFVAPAETLPVNERDTEGERVQPLPRLATRKPAGHPAEFYCVETGDRFLPRGFNHTVLSEGARGWHATFNTGRYDPVAMEAVLTEMAALGANTIRVWAWGEQDETGFTGGPEGQGLNPDYMANFVDFLRRCTRHGIYVVAILDETPHNARYRAIAEAAQGQPNDTIGGYNRRYLTRGLIAAKAAAAADFVRQVKERDPGLLRTILGWALANEVFVRTDHAPFPADSGHARNATGKEYSLADKLSRQALYDDGVVYWANTIARAIREVDPDALVTAGMWTSDAHGRDPVNGLYPDGRDARIPPRPSVLGGPASALDWIGVHIYPWDKTAVVRPDAHERDALRDSEKPVIVGEYGVFKNKTLDEAKGMMREMLAQAYAMGYRGDLFWVWDLRTVRGQTWSAVEADIAAFVMGLDAVRGVDAPAPSCNTD